MASGPLRTRSCGVILDRVTDLAYAVVFVAGFLVLVLTLRGLEKL